MSSLDVIHFTNLEFGLIVLVLALTVAFIFSRRTVTQKPDRAGQTVDFEGFMEWLKESESICENLSKNLQEKRKIAKRLIAQLDGRIEQMNQILKRLDEKETPASDEATCKDLQPLIIEMSDSGCTVSQIARWMRIPEGQVQLVLDLRKFGDAQTREPQPGNSPVQKSRSDIRYSDSGFSPTDTP